MSRPGYPTLSWTAVTGILTGRTALLIWAILAITVGFPLASAVATGAVAIPHNDDWAFSRIAVRLAEHGELRLVGWGQMSLIGHVLWAQPFLAVFGHSQEVLHGAQALAAAAGLVAAYFVFRRFLTSGVALFATALVAAFPGYALLATTFMTDTTAFAAQMGCLLFGLLALDRRRQEAPLLALSLVLGVYAFTIREIALAAPLAVLSGRLIAVKSARQRRETATAIALVLLFALAFVIWRHQLPGDDESPWQVGEAGYYERGEQLVRAFFTCAFAALPALLLVFPRLARGCRTRWSLTAAVFALALGSATIVREPAGPFTLFTGNLLTRRGAVPVSLPGRDVLFPAPVWVLMTLAALLAGALLAATLAAAARSLEQGRLDAARHAIRGAQHRISPPYVVLAVYALLPVLLLVLRAGSGAWVLFDRYLWPTQVPLLVVVLGLLKPSPTVGRAVRFVAGTAAVLLVGLSLALVVEEHVSSAARWNAASAAVSAGFSPVEIDGGFEWMGWHYPVAVGAHGGPPRWRPPASWYNALEFPAAGNCILMSFSRRDEPWLRLVEVREYRSLPWSRRALFVYRNPPACL